MGVNVNTEFLDLAERFLHCSVGSIPFIYVGLPVGANPRKESTWKPLLFSLSRKLGVWRNSQGRKIAWVSWTKVCRPKSCGGLGIRDFHDVNLALLGSRPNGFTGVSLWWKDVSLLGDSTVTCSYWFSDAMKEGWLFQVSEQCLDLVGDMGSWVQGEWNWDFRWKRELSLVEFDLAHDLMKVVTQSPTLGVEDSWVLKYDPSGRFSVRSAYLTLTGPKVVSDPNPLLSRVWKSWDPLKVIVFSWKLLQDRVATRQNLLRRQVIRDISDSFCAFCGVSVESVDHLFTSCDFIFPVWYKLVRWLGFQFVSPNSIIGLFEGFLGFSVNRKFRLGCVLIWHAAVWSIWNSLYDLIFARGTVSIDTLVEKVKLSSWKWLLAKNPGNPCSFYEWEVQLVMYWSR
ncbi:hypothetical protein TSUD_266930 [Trifolium subterraneum]|uniref:Reverse transcriptase zinc-binding domain-containing protein n=1 Tax=Trifolium subterraneum TaxID=3900 RepID=A0A2Z6M5M2_TRISU|nr:hypothetical protein TSUD_266930 [Trifolium subterraneum]